MNLSNRMKFIVIAAIALVAPIASAHAQLVVGTTDGANFIPFGASIPVYQQVYAASDFSGPIGINGLTFYQTYTSGGTLYSANYEFELSTTTAPVNGLSYNFADNIGADNTIVYNSTLSGPVGSQLTLNTSLFNYNPANGNLLLTIYQTGGSGDQYSLFLDSMGDSMGLYSRISSSSSSTTADNFDFGGLVTGFSSTTVPEPSTYALLIAGLALLAFRLRRARV